MSQVKRFNFDNSNDWTFDSAKVQFVGGVAKLILQDNPNQLFPIDFSSDTGFTYDSSKAEFTGGKVQQKANSIVESYSQPFTASTGFTYNSSYVEFASGVARQKSQVPTNATFGATYTSSINGSFGNGTLTGTPTGGASISGNRLDLTGGTTKYVTYSAVNNADSRQTGCIRFKMTPNYTGAPASLQTLMDLYDSSGFSRIKIYHVSTLLFLSVSNNVGATIISSAQSWSPVSGTTYEFEFNYDVTVGASRLFIDGVQLGSTHSGTGTRGNATSLRIGSDQGASSTSNMYIEDLVIFNLEQHTSNYTPGYTLPEAKYVETVVTCPAVSYTYNIVSFGSPTITSVNSPRYIVNGYAYFGGSWQTSSDTYATAMTYSDWQANISTFPSGQFGTEVVVKVIFQGSNTLGSIDDISFDINEERYVETTVTTPELTYTDAGTLVSFDAFTTVDANSPRYSIQVGRSGNYLYWDGSSWTVSDGSYAQANDETTFNANLSSLNILGQIYGQFKIHFDNGVVQMNVDNLEANLTAQVYPTTDQTIESIDTILSDSYISFEESVSKPANTNITWVIKRKDNNYYYFNGASWVSSNLTEAQANDITTINSNISGIIPSGNNYELIKLVAILSSDGTATPEATYIESTYSFYSLEPTSPINTTTLYFYIHDLLNIEFSEATFYVSGKKSFFHTERLIIPFEHNVEANSEGYVEIDVIETTTVNKKLEFKLDYVDPNDSTTKTIKFKSALIPNQTLTKGSEILTPK